MDNRGRHLLRDKSCPAALISWSLFAIQQLRDHSIVHSAIFLLPVNMESKREKLIKLKEAYILQMEKNLEMIKEKEQLEDKQIETKKAIKEIKRNCHQMFTELRIGSDSSKINLPITGSTIATQTVINSSLSDYSVYIPDRRVSFNASINCEGCGKTFRGYYGKKYRRIIFREPAFYVHCIKECQEYTKLNKIQKCHECKLLFVNRHSYSWHLKKIHRDSVKHLDGNVYNSSKACPGCGQELPVNRYRKGRIDISRVYSKHCVEECEEYKKLNLIRKCNDCGNSFLNQSSLASHQRSDTNSCRKNKKPDWLSKIIPIVLDTNP